MVSITNMNHEQARKFFLKNESYCNLWLPPYFNFSNLLNNLSNEIWDNIDDHKIFFKDNNNDNSPKNFENVNYSIMINKDGKYWWRKIQFINPVLYVILVHYLTKEDNWNIIVNKINSFNNDHIICTSRPNESDSNESDKWENIKNWLHHHEEYWLELSLDFPYLIKTDISWCYNSIYTHSISRVFDGIDKTKIAKKSPESKKQLFWHFIDEYLMSMSYWQTNWIPEWSILMDFLAELVLWFIDSLLLENIKEKYPQWNYKIVRFRDDYNIFIDNLEFWDFIIKQLSTILSNMRMKLNENKTIITNNVIWWIIKRDKIQRFIDFVWLSNLDDDNVKYINNIKKELLIINKFSEDYPNSGSLYDILDKFSKKLDINRINQFTDVKVLIAISINIAYNSPRLYPSIFKIISILLKKIANTDEKNEIFHSMFNKLSRLPKSEYLNLRIQRIWHKYWIKLYNEDDLLCKIVDENACDIWNNEWLEEKYTNIINSTPIIDKTVLEDISDEIQDDEIKPFLY